MCFFHKCRHVLSDLTNVLVQDEKQKCEESQKDEDADQVSQNAVKMCFFLKELNQGENKKTEDHSENNGAEKPSGYDDPVEKENDEQQNERKGYNLWWFV